MRYEGVIATLRERQEGGASFESLLENRICRLSNEIERLKKDAEADKAKLDEAVAARSDSEGLLAQVKALRISEQDLIRKLCCPHCRAPLSRRESVSEPHEDAAGHEESIEHLIETFECGFVVFDGEEEEPCETTAKTRFDRSEKLPF